MGNCACLSTPTHKQPPIHTNNDIHHNNPSPSPPPPPNLHKTSILSVASTSSATITNSPRTLNNTNTNPQNSPTSTSDDDNKLKILTTNNTTYNAMIATRDRNLTNSSNSTNCSSSIEKLYEIASIPNTFSIDDNEQEITQKEEEEDTEIPSIAVLSKQPQPKHLPIPNNKSNTNNIKDVVPKRTLTKGTSHSQSNSVAFIRSTPSATPPTKSIENPSYYPSPSPPLRSQHSQQSLSSNGGSILNKRSSFTLSATTSNGTNNKDKENQNANNNFNVTQCNISKMAALPQREERYSNSRSSIKHISHLKDRNNINDINNINNINHLTPSIITAETRLSSCCCDEIQNSNLDIITIPSIWCIDHDDMLKYMLSQWLIPMDLFETFKSYLIDIDNMRISKPLNGSYHKSIRNGLSSLSFCPCWYDQFEDGFRIMQFGYCPGTTQFALKFIRNNDKAPVATTKCFESRSRFATNINMNIINDINHIQYDPRKVLGIEIFDMNIAEFPTMIPSYLESYDPHVILLLFDVADRSSFDGIIKMRKSLENLYESLEEKTEYELNSGYNTNSHQHSTNNANKNNLKRFHDSFDAIASVFGFGHNNSSNNNNSNDRDREKSKSKSKSKVNTENHDHAQKSKKRPLKTIRSNSVASILSNISSSIKNNTTKHNNNNNNTILKRARTHSNLNKNNNNNTNNKSGTILSTRYSSESTKVNQSNKNEFTIQPLKERENSKSLSTYSSPTQCGNSNDISCYYHNNNNSDDYYTQSMISSMPPILVIGIHADINDKDRNVSIEEGLKLSKKWEVPYLETSALNGINVNHVFTECVRTRWVYDTYPNVRVRSRAVLIT